MRVAIVGYGGVAAVHARQLKSAGSVLTSVCGPDIQKAKAFASIHGFERAETTMDAVLKDCEAVVIASPSPVHYEQGIRALEQRIPALIELPACASLREATELARLAAEARVTVQCAHTSRYLEPYRAVKAWIDEGRLGAIQQVHYFRCIPPRSRSWTDDALLHHAAHPLDLFLHWFGAAEPRGCVGRPRESEPQDVSLLAEIPGGGPATITISYTAPLPHVRMTVIGAEHTIATDGFSYVQSDDPELGWQGSEQEVYEAAIRLQDGAFLECCQTGVGGVPWDQTLDLVRRTEQFKKLWLRAERF
jgi:2-hydroxy-4-carboxymuconate semialdehyde hemiacetal dehydrogenase